MNSSGGLPRLIELGLTFLRLGATSFGGPAAHIALMEEEVVTRRRWLSREDFVDFLGVTNLLPGPNSTEMAMHVGRVRAGPAGLVVAGVCFILPATLTVMVLAWGYVRGGTLPRVEAMLYAVQPVIIAVLLQALVRLARTTFRSAPSVIVAALALGAAAIGVRELPVLALGAAISVLLRVPASSVAGEAMGLFALMPPAMHDAPRTDQGAARGALITGVASAGALGGAVALWPLLAVFLKIGSVLFGSGYVLLAFLRSDLVERLRWLTERQVIDAVAAGQLTPGPLFTAATFIGYLLRGPTGALVATVGIFLPAFVFVAISAPLVTRVRASRLAGAALDGVNAASIALLVLVTWQLERAAIVDITTALIAVGGLAILLRGRVNSTWLIVIACVGGFLWLQR